MEKVIRIGEQFESFDLFKATLKKYEQEKCANYPVYNSARDHENDNLKYRWARFKCKLSGDHIKDTSARNTKSYKQDCSSYIYVAQQLNDHNVSVLQIIKMSEIHNHIANESLFKHIVNQRKSTIEKHRDLLENILPTKPNLRALQQQINEKGDGIIYLKDLHNLKSSLKESLHQNDLVQLMNEMLKIDNATVRVFYDQNDELDCIFFQDKRMKMYFERFPELVMFDGTYKLNDRRMPLVIMLIVDGNGESQIVNLCVVRSENQTTFIQLFDEFKKENGNHEKIEVIMSDKAFANRNAFRSAFPKAKHQLCVFHVLQIMNREITTQKRNLKPAVREVALRIVRRMVYAKTQTEYDECHRELAGLNSRELTDYFENNWDNIQDQWVGYKVNQHANFENRSNNRLESLNQKIKTVVTKYSNLSSFFNDLMICIGSYNVERDHIAADSILRKSLATSHDTRYDKQYAILLTQYAYNKYKPQSMKANRIQFSKICELTAECLENNKVIEITDEQCSCAFFNTMKLPCSHVIAFLLFHGESPFKPTLCANRWKRENADFASQFEYPIESSQVQIVRTTTQQSARRMNPNEKFRAAEKETKKICEILAEKSQIEFDQWMEKLKKFRISVEKNDLEADPIDQGN